MHSSEDPANENLHQRALDLRQGMTDAEQFVWRKLRNQRFGPFKFRRQFVIGGYIVDFICHHKRLILELDGGQHTLQCEYDELRTKFLKSEGYRVIRFWNHEVLTDWETVAEEIWRQLHLS